MGLFYRRPLCLFAFLFVAFSLFGFLLDDTMLLISLGVLALLLLLLCGVSVTVQRLRARRALCLTGILALIVAMFAVAYSFLTVTLPLRNAERFAGERLFVAEVVREEYRADDYARYSVLLINIDGESTNISATLFCNSDREFSPKDRIAAKGMMESPKEKDRDGSLLFVSVEEGTDLYLQARSEHLSVGELLRSPSGIVVLSERCQSFLRERMLTLLGEQDGSLAVAFFVGDRSALSDSTVRDFSRSGVSHLMAVSGLHFSVLLGAFDILLRALCCPKKGRLVFISVAGVFFLFLTGFSMSACRSALMLYALYLTFLFQEEADSITSLFCSFALIVLVSPLAIADVGLWMSFLATLGLLTLYPLISEKIPTVKVKRWYVRLPLRMARGVLMLALITTIATLFLLPVLWLYWGEFSGVSLLANPILSPLSYLFLIGIPIWLALSSVPLVGAALGMAMCGLSQAILWLVGFFSGLPSATVSLNYSFCRILIPLFAVAMIAVLVVRFSKRWLVFLPPIALILSFGICFAAVQWSHRTPMVRCVTSQGSQDVLWISDGDEVALCDASSGSVFLYREVIAELSELSATEIQSVVLTHYHYGHISAMKFLLEKEMVRALYLPTPHDAENREIATEIWRTAVDAGSEVVFYEDAELSLTERITASISTVSAESLALLVTVSSEQERLSYVTPSYLALCEEEKLSEQIKQSKTVLVGSHGRQNGDTVRSLSEEGSVERVIYCSKKLSTRLRVENAEHYVADPNAWWATELP